MIGTFAILGAILFGLIVGYGIGEYRVKKFKLWHTNEVLTTLDEGAKHVAGMVEEMKSNVMGQVRTIRMHADASGTCVTIALRGMGEVATDLMKDADTSNVAVIAAIEKIKRTMERMKAIAEEHHVPDSMPDDIPAPGGEE